MAYAREKHRVVNTVPIQVWTTRRFVTEMDLAAERKGLSRAEWMRQALAAAVADEAPPG
jgi:hypothetical protein